MSTSSSLAVRILTDTGVTLGQVAEWAETSKASVAAQLAGRRLLEVKVLDAIREHVGWAVADEVQPAAAKARSAYLLEVQAGRM